MRRHRLFGSRFALSLALFIVTSLTLLLFSLAPLRVEGGIAWVYFQPLEQSQNTIYTRISGHELSCLSQTHLEQCTIEIENQPLIMSVIYKDGTKREMWDYDNVKCQATYAEKPISCEVNYDYATYKLPLVYLKSEELGLSAAQLQALQDKSLLSDFYDQDWVRLTTIVAIVSGICIAGSIGLHPDRINRSHASLGAGLGTAVLIFGYQVGYVPSLYWHWGTLGLAILLGGAIGVGIFTAFVASYEPRLAKLITSLSMGFVAFGISWMVFSVALLTLGFVD